MKLLIAAIFAFLFAISPAHSADIRTMAAVAQGGGSFPTMGGGSYGVGARFEYGLSPYVSLVFPVEFRFIAMGGFAESPKFWATTVGWGGRFYFSQLFWQQNSLTGFYAEIHTGIGYGYEQRGDDQGRPGPKNSGATFSFSAMIGYAHTFDLGLIIGGGVQYTGRGFVAPILARGIVFHPNPELLVNAGWAF